MAVGIELKEIVDGAGVELDVIGSGVVSISAVAGEELVATTVATEVVFVADVISPDAD